MIRKIAESKSKTFFAILLAFVLGVLVYSFTPVRMPMVFGFCVLAFAGILILVWKKPIERLVILALLFFSLGLFRFAFDAMRLDISDVNERIGQTISVRGVVVALPEVRGNKTKYVVDIQDEFRERAWQSFDGRLVLWASRFPEFVYGDRLMFSCKFESYEDSGKLSVQHASASCYTHEGVEKIGINVGDPIMGVLMKLRTRMLGKLGEILPEPQAGLVAGLTVGERAAIPSALALAMRRTGTTHIVAISGFNVAMMTSTLFLFLMAVALPRKKAFWVTLVALIIFVFFVGAGASVVRAAIMGTTVLLGAYTGRQGSSLRLLVCAAAIMLAINPWLLRYDLGFVLSFAATFGLIIFTKPFAHYLRFIPHEFSIRGTVTETSAATFATLPLTVFFFGMISFIAPFANVLVLLIVPTLTWLGFFTVVLSFIPIISHILVFITWAMSTAVLGFIEVLGKLPFAAIEVGNLTIVGAILWTVFVLLFAWYLYYGSVAK